MRHIREGKHGARSTKQAIAIGLSEARRAGVDLPRPEKGTVSEKTRRSAKRAYESGRRTKRKRSDRRSRATEGALGRERQGRRLQESSVEASAFRGAKAARGSCCTNSRRRQINSSIAGISVAISLVSLLQLSMSETNQ